MRRPSLILIASLALVAGAASGQARGAAGIPFGLFGMMGRDLVDPFTSAMQRAQPESILDDLAAAKARNAHIVVNFTGSPAKFLDGSGHFNLDMWKAKMDRFRPMAAQLNEYVSDGTILAVMIVDEPFARKRWGGETIPMATVDEMAEYSKSLFPDLPTAVRAAPSELKGYQWRWLDVAWAQYTARKGPISEYVTGEVSGAKAEGLGLIVGLNISKGGDGSSGFGSADESGMSGEEILRYGHALLDSPYPCAFISWDNRPAVINRPDVAAALKELAAAAQAHPTASCRQEGAHRTS